MPNWSTMYAASSGESAMFFGVSGSIAGGQMNASGRSVASGRIRACGRSRRRTGGSTAAARRQSRFGVERSMWQRQIHFARPSPGTWSIIADRLRVVDDHEVVLVSRTPRRSRAL